MLTRMLTRSLFINVEKCHLYNKKASLTLRKRATAARIWKSLVLSKK